MCSCINRSPLGMISSLTCSHLLFCCTLIHNMSTHFCSRVFLLGQEMPCQEQIQAQKSSFADESCSPLYYHRSGPSTQCLVTNPRNMCTHWELAKWLGRKESNLVKTSAQMSCKNEKDHEGEMVKSHMGIKPSERVKCQSLRKQCLGFCHHLIVFCCLLGSHLHVQAVLSAASLLSFQQNQTAPLSIPGCCSTILPRQVLLFL